jgi:hypothetical protein
MPTAKPISSESGKKGQIKQGQLADLAVLSDLSFSTGGHDSGHHLRFYVDLFA